MPAIKRHLEVFLKGSTKVALLGVGSELCGDDAAGIMVARRLNCACRKKSDIGIFLGGSAPENLTGQIKRFKPERLIIIDTVLSGKRPGAISLFSSEKISGVSFSTHRMPLKFITAYLSRTLPCQVIVAAIEPKSLAFGLAVSRQVEEAVKLLCNIIEEALDTR